MLLPITTSKITNITFPIYKKTGSRYNINMSAPTNLTTRNNPEVSTKLADPQKMYAKQAAATPGQTASVDNLSTSEGMNAIDRRTGKSRLFSMETPGELIQKQQGPKGILSQQQSLLTGG